MSDDKAIRHLGEYFSQLLAHNLDYELPTLRRRDEPGCRTVCQYRCSRTSQERRLACRYRLARRYSLPAAAFLRSTALSKRLRRRMLLGVISTSSSSWMYSSASSNVNVTGGVSWMALSALLER